VALTKRDRQFDSADKRPLTTAELRVYWRLIEKLPGLRGRCLRLLLLTGGQCIEPLVRLRWADVRADPITIYDTRRRRGQCARTHTVPIVMGAARDLQSFERVGDHFLSTIKGFKSISGSTLPAEQPRSSAMQSTAFSASGVRSGVETLLTANRMSGEIRGHVQSHGLTAIQARHSDGHDQLMEKHLALNALARELTGGSTRSRTAKPLRKADAAGRRMTHGPRQRRLAVSKCH
jgi:hypothetical protein